MDYTDVAEAALIKGCATKNVEGAVTAGELDSIQVLGGTFVVVLNKKFMDWRRK